MIVYVESNFLVEAAALQEEHGSCYEILKLAEKDRVQLRVPAFSIAEPIHTIRARHARRVELRAKLTGEIRLLRRTAGYEDRLREAGDILTIFDESRREEQRRLDDVLTRTASAGEIIPLTAASLVEAVELRDRHGLSHSDAMVLAAVSSDLNAAPAMARCFLQRDKDFRTSEIIETLEAAGCRLLAGFSDGLAYIREALE